VSVVLPFRVGQRYADEAFASIRSQTVSPAEVVVVDDGSGADGRAYLDRVIRDTASNGTVTSFRLLTLDSPQGPGPARNAGVAASAQPCIAFLDADDIWAPDKLAKQYALMDAWPGLDATHTDAVSFRSDGSELAREQGPRRLTVATALSNHVMITPSIMIRKSTFERLGGFDPAFGCTQDWELQIRMAQAGCEVQYIPDVLVRVRRQDHGNHSANWRCYLAGHMRIVWKHRALYRERVGWRGWIRLGSFEAYRAGVRRGGLLGLALQVPYRAGV
jgi:glycosyltransferase involved in cell wall biosynthesis